MSAWVKQLKSQVEKLGPEKASWYVEWDEEDGTRRCKSCGPGPSGKKTAGRLCERIKAELLTGTYNQTAKRKWREFTAEYKEKVLSGLKASSEREMLTSLGHFERILKLTDKNVTAVTASRIADFKSKRRKDRGKKPGSTVSPATINKDLRNVKAALGVAVDWGHLPAVPRIKFEKEPTKLPTYISPEHFALIYGACDVAQKPAGIPYPAADWWRALLVMAQMTGWRISELLAVSREDVDLKKATAITRAADNKGNRDEMIALHGVVIDHLERIRSFADQKRLFPWPHHRRTLDNEFARIQDAAGIYLPCNDRRPHDCTPACHRYGFHDERRAFATMNAPNMSREALQRLMRHKSSLTTEWYINMAQQLDPAIANLHVPEILRTEAIG